MSTTSDQFTVLEMVDRFSGFKRYGGVMPMRLLASREELIDALISNRLLTFKEARPKGGWCVEGVCLTDFGRRLLRTR